MFLNCNKGVTFIISSSPSDQCFYKNFNFFYKKKNVIAVIVVIYN